LRSWALGRPYDTTEGTRHFQPLLKPAKKTPPTLSFANLVEAHVLRALRTAHDVPLKAVRKAIDYAERDLKIDRLLLREDLRTEGGEVFLDHFGQLVNLSNSGQLAIRRLLLDHLKRIEWDTKNFPIRLYPFVTAGAESESRSILIDPQISFGRPVVHGAFISTRSIADRIDAGESVEDLAKDYDITREEIEQAAVYEQAA
jgi:uncharacterized protein (DUF433 family)